MASIPQKIIVEFQEAVKEEYGKELSMEEAFEILHGITQYFHLLAKIDRRIAE